jgi:hypothetical protein
MEVFNITNTPSFDTPGNNFTGNPNFGNPPTHNDPTTGNTLPGATPIGPDATSAYSAAFSSQGVGAVTNPIGSPRQVQFYGIFSF